LTHLIGAPGDEGHDAELELASTTKALEAVQEDRHRIAADPLKRFADALPGDG